mgnify:CR=1 FL=1
MVKIGLPTAARWREKYEADLFNTEMVRAILDGRKTVTRRPVKFGRGRNPKWSGYVPDGGVLYGSNNIPAAKAPYQAGDILWVRETWTSVPGGSYIYKVSVECLMLGVGPGTPPFTCRKRPPGCSYGW